MQERLRQLPQVQQLLESPQALVLIDRYGRNDVADAIRKQLGEIRKLILADEGGADMASDDLLFKHVERRLSASREVSLKPVINATGILIHTNLGRAPLAAEAIEAIARTSASYSTLEFRMADGKRGSRNDHVEALICELTGAEAAIVVNNCAAAILTSLTALAEGQEVIASRGELVEIGGSFRMPDIVVQSGARLKEVGTTNKTHLLDYRAAIGAETALMLKSHTSNFRIVGFTSAPSRADLADLARQHGVLFIEDLGSGVLTELTRYGLPDEPVVRDVLRSGVDLVTFSGDKLLGGPQAGIIAGRRALVDRIKAHAMSRAVRIDKLSLAALSATLELYRPPNDPFEKIPVLRMLSEPLHLVKARGERLLEAMGNIRDARLELVETVARTGAGSLPEQDLPSFALSVDSDVCSVNELSARLRSGPIPIVGRILHDRLVLDVRAMFDNDVGQVASSLQRALDA